MTTVYLNNMNGATKIEAGYVNLYGSTGIRYRNRALNIPGYGWVPCSRKLQGNFTTNPRDLMIVISEPSDSDHCVTSDIWVTRSNVIKTIG